MVCSPLGVVQMTVLAESLQADPVRGGLLALVRLVTIIVIIPPILLLVAG